MGLLNKNYGLVQAGRCLFNIFCDDKFEQSGADRRVFHKFDDGEVEMVVFLRVDNIHAHVQATMVRFATELGDESNEKSMVDKFGVKDTSRTPAYLGVSTPCG